MKDAPKVFNKNLLLLLLGRVVSDTGSSIQMLIMPLYIIDRGGSAATVGLFSFLTLMPILIVYPFAGVIGDRLNRKKIMVAADFSSAIIVLLLGYISYVDKLNIALLLIIQVFISLFYGFFDPATKGMIPMLVEEEELNKTNSKVASLRILSGIVAPLIAVTLYSNYGVTLLFIINGVSFLISGISETFISYKHIKKESAKGFKGILEELAEGILFIKNNEVIRKLSVFFLMIFAFIQPVFGVILPLFFRTRLVYTDTQYGYIQITLFVGALLGTVLAGMINEEKDLIKPLRTGVISVVIAMLAFSGLLFPFVVSAVGNSSLVYIILFAGSMFILYTSILYIYIPLQTLIQTKTPNEYMSRVFSIVGLISKGGMPLGAIVYGVVLNRVEIHTTVAVAAVMILLISIQFLMSIGKIDELNHSR